MIFSRIKKAWKLASKQPEQVDALLANEIEGLADLGDGKAEFLGDGSQEEFKESENEKKGLKGIFGIGK